MAGARRANVSRAASEAARLAVRPVAGMDPPARAAGPPVRAAAHEATSGEEDHARRWTLFCVHRMFLLQRRKASLRLHHSKARIAALMLAPQNQ